MARSAHRRPQRRRVRPGRRKWRRGASGRERGLALIMAITTIAILSVVVVDMHESTTTSFVVTMADTHQMRAEYVAKSGHNLTRLLVGLEPAIRRTVAPIYRMMLGRPPPQLPIWRLANEILQPFCDYEAATENAGGLGIDLDEGEGLNALGGSCEIVAFSENSRINVNDPLFLDGDRARRSISMQLFALMGGFQSPSPYDPIFQNRDPDGLFSPRLEVLSAMVDWWDEDSERTTFDPGAGRVDSAGSEDNVYASFDDSYQIKNAPFDSIQEIRLVRGVSDDFWATFVEPDPYDPASRILTIYGSGSVNPNEAEPEVILARLCSFVEQVSLCIDPLEAQKFIQILKTARGIAPVPFFSRASDFTNFVEGRGGSRDLYPMLRALLGQDNPLLFTPIVIPQERKSEIANAFVLGASIISINVTGRYGRAKVQMNTVMNFHDRWTPPPPNAGRMPPLGIFHYYRLE